MGDQTSVQQVQTQETGRAPPEPFQAHERFEHFVVIEVRSPLPTSKEAVLLALK
jgi:hypothetical protein